MEILQLKFNAYFQFTAPLTKERGIPIPNSDRFIYPNDSILSDITVLAALFSEFYEQASRDFSLLVPQYPEAFKVLTEMVQIFWRETSGNLSLDATNPDHMELLSKTLRDGFQHFNYRYGDWTSKEYFQQLSSVVPAVVLAKIPNVITDEHRDKSEGYYCYLIDFKYIGRIGQFKDVRVVKTTYADLRYKLHLFFAKMFAKVNQQQTCYDCFKRSIQM